MNSYKAGLIIIMKWRKVTILWAHSMVLVCRDSQEMMLIDLV